MSAERFVWELDRCPHCDGGWNYWFAGKRYSHLIARVWDDRVGQWVCSHCDARWDRNAVVES